MIWDGGCSSEVGADLLGQDIPHELSGSPLGTIVSILHSAISLRPLLFVEKAKPYMKVSVPWQDECKDEMKDKCRQRMLSQNQ